MHGIEMVDLFGNRKAVAAEAIEALAANTRGTVIRPGEPEFDETRAIWNAMIDRRPGLIVRCTGVADVLGAVRFAQAHDLLVSVHGGGHQIAGNAVCEGGLMIDLSLMNSVRVDPGEQRVHVGPGATLGDVDHETQAFGLAIPTGINSTTGIAGLTLGGGFGWLSRKLGMTVDSLVAADVVTADGRLLRASESEHADLFWALRGGGGNFGVVTRFEFRAHPVGPELLSGLVVYPLADAPTALRKYREFVDGLGPETAVWVVLRKAPPLPFLPANVHGQEVLVFAVCHAGDPAEGEKALAPVSTWGTPVGSHVGVQPFRAWQAAFDPLLTPGARNYWKSHNFTDLSDGAIDTAIRYAGNLPTAECEIFFASLGHATSSVPADATAYPHRDAKYVMNVHGRWQSPDEDEAGIRWARAFFDETAPYATGGVYINFMTDDEGDRVAAAYGSSFARLAKIKKSYDPGNRFRLNQNVRPA